MTDEPEGKGWKRNTGTEPKGKKKRVEVILANGERSGDKPLTTTAPTGWLVETTRWTLTGSPFDVEWYRYVR